MPQRYENDKSASFYFMQINLGIMQNGKNTARHHARRP